MRKVVTTLATNGTLQGGATETTDHFCDALSFDGNTNTAPIDYRAATSSDLMIGNYAGCSGLDFSGKIASQYLPQQFPNDAVL